MSSFNLQEIINHWLQSDWFKSLLVPTKTVYENGDPIPSGRSSRHQRALIKKLNDQQLLVDQMNLQAKEQLYVIEQLHKRMKLYMIIGLVLLGSLSAGLIATLIHFWH